MDRTQETLTPYHYKVVTSEGGKEQRIVTEFTATSRASFFKFKYPGKEKAFLYLKPVEGRKVEALRFFRKEEKYIYTMKIDMMPT